MKIIIAGANGYIGTHILKHAIADPEISHIFTLTRRPMPKEWAQHEKVTAIVHKDFLMYDKTLMEKLKGAEACLWCVFSFHFI